MSLQDWLDRNSEPGPVGGVDVGARARDEPSRSVVWFCGLVSIALLAAWAYVGWRACRGDLVTFAVGASLTATYLLAGYYVHPAPNHDNLGWCDGLIDNPFRISDGVNRFLIFFTAFLWPGRFVAESLAALLRSRNSPG